MKEKTNKKYFCYKWVLDGKIVYVGLTKNIKNRIYQERRDDKFQDYLNSDILFVEVANSTEMKGLEKLLINKYKPELNDIDNQPGDSGIPLEDKKLNWKHYADSGFIGKTNSNIDAAQLMIKRLLDIESQISFDTEIMMRLKFMAQHNISLQSFYSDEDKMHTKTIKEICEYLKEAGGVVNRSYEKCCDTLNTDCDEDSKIICPDEFKEGGEDSFHISVHSWENAENQFSIEIVADLDSKLPVGIRFMQTDIDFIDKYIALAPKRLAQIEAKIHTFENVISNFKEEKAKQLQALGVA